MFREYALEPALISSWDRARFFLDSFGPWKGRFLAEYPRQWKKMVFQGLSCPDLEKKRITERLNQLDKRVFSARMNAPYDGARPWIDNAHIEHLRSPFDAIIARETSGQPHVLDGSEIDDRNELWRIDAGLLLDRDPNTYVHALRLLLAASRRVVLIDPYFRADQHQKRNPLIAVCVAVYPTATVEVHLSDGSRGYDKEVGDAALALPKFLPPGVEVTLYCWKERSGGPRLHNRYLITDVGGVEFGDGIELGDPGQQDRISILEEASRSKLWDDYVGPSPAFDPAGVSQTFRGR
jgi:hypothetical protein